MALTVETGAIVAGADSFVSIVDASAYHLARGNSAWAAATDSAKEIALRLAAEYMSTAYSWNGLRVSKLQTLSWPRTGTYDCDSFAIDLDEIPTAVINAQCELALRALSGSLVADVLPGQQVVREKVDVLEVEYSKGRELQTRFTMVDNMLRCLLSRGTSQYGTIELVRV